jgi:hypothetical protein
MSEWFQLAFATLSALATGFAAYAAWRAPLSAAKLAEELRRSTERDNERRRLKLHVFASLMQERASLASLEGVRALNLIDVVFHDCRSVREAWAELFLSFDGSKKIPSHVQEERTRKLLTAMAVNLGLGDELRSDDLGRVYYPNALAEEEYVRQLERQATKARLEGQAPTANTAPPKTSPWPPKPE